MIVKTGSAISAVAAAAREAETALEAAAAALDEYADSVSEEDDEAEVTEHSGRKDDVHAR